MTQVETITIHPFFCTLVFYPFEGGELYACAFPPIVQYVNFSHSISRNTG